MDSSKGEREGEKRELVMLLWAFMNAFSFFFFLLKGFLFK